jgi:hypothetical protein
MTSLALPQLKLEVFGSILFGKKDYYNYDAWKSFAIGFNFYSFRNQGRANSLSRPCPLSPEAFIDVSALPLLHALCCMPFNP